MAEPKYTVKGTHVLMARKWVDQKLGEGTFTKMASAKAELPVFLPSSWYPVAPIAYAIQMAARELRISVEDASTEIAEQNARTDLTTVYRAFLRVAGPHMVMNATTSLWRNYVAFADAKKVENVPGRFLGECRDIPNDLLDWACGCWRGFVPTAIQLAGGKNCKHKIVQRGPQEGSKEFSWLQLEVLYQ